MPIYSNSLEDIFKQIKETNLKAPYYICGCILDSGCATYVADVLFASFQLDAAVRHSFTEQFFNNPSKEWSKMYFTITLCGGEDKDNISCSASLTKDQYNGLCESLGQDELLENFSNELKEELFIYLVEKLSK